MIKPLRKRHKHIWILLAVLLPAGFISAYLVIPDQVLNNTELSPVKQPSAFSDVIFTVDDEYLLLNVRQENGKKQIEIVIKQPLTRASTILYLSDEINPDIKQALLLGAIGTRAVYRFDMYNGKQYEFLLLYDSIKRELYRTLKLN